MTRVLLVDDDPLNVRLATYVLEAAGLVVESSMDPLAALERLAQAAHAAPDVILMDIQMPGLDGLALTRRIKDDPATRHIPVVAFTAYAMKGDAERFRAAGCDGYLSKPIDVAVFAAQVRALARPGAAAG